MIQSSITNIPLKHYWDKTGQQYYLAWKSQAQKEMSKKELSFIMDYLAKTSSKIVLDIGVGTGRIIGKYINENKIDSIYGIDISPVMINICRKKYAHCNKLKALKICNLEKQEIPYRIKFDFISAIRIFKYIKDWQKALKKIKTNLNSNGICVFTILNPFSFNILTNLLKSEITTYKSTITDIKKICC